jgi:hypothetical protein
VNSVPFVGESSPSIRDRFVGIDVLAFPIGDSVFIRQYAFGAARGMGSVDLRKVLSQS